MDTCTDKAPVDPSLGMKVTLAAIHARYSNVDQISTDDFYKKWTAIKNSNRQAAESASHDESTSDDLIILDVREKAERDVSFIEDSIWIDSSQDSKANVDTVKSIINEHVKTKPEKNVNLNVVAYCSIGYRSSDLIYNIDKNDIARMVPSSVKINFYNLNGSVFKWANEGKPLVNSGNLSTCFAHPYNAVWGKLLNKKLRKTAL